MSRAGLSRAARAWLHVLDKRSGSASWDEVFELVVEHGFEREAVFDAYYEAKRHGHLRDIRGDRVELARSGS